MSLEKSEIIILRRLVVRDSSLFLIVLSPEWGKITLTARGALKPGSQVAEALQYFNVADIVVYKREKESADYISKAEVKESFADITYDERCYAIAAAALEFVNLFLPEDESNREIYFLLKKYLRNLSKQEKRDLTTELLHFWYQLCILAGYAPDLGHCAGCGSEIDRPEVNFSPEAGGVICANCLGADQLLIKLDKGTIKVMQNLVETDISAKKSIALSDAQKKQIKQVLRAISEFHIGRSADLKSFDFLRKLNFFSTNGG